MRRDPSHAMRVAFVGTYPPRQCGIATFTRDLAAAVAGPRTPSSWTRAGGPAAHRSWTDIVALDRDARDFPPEVRARLDPDRPADYLRVADLLNRSSYAAVSLQHEFGIYGGADGRRVLDLLDELRLPVVATLHTVLRHPSESQRDILRRIVRSAARTVVLSRGSAAVLVDAYGANPDRLSVIPHGVPDLELVDPDTVKPLVGLAGRPTILSFGLLGPGKGYELGIRAMTDIVRSVPDACYVILGATHPDLRRREGEAYRDSLKAIVQTLDLGRHVRFVDAYVDRETLGRWLQAADVFVTPYPGADQAVSGTLAYALGVGKALVSTPYAYARELLADGRGRLVPFGDSASLAAAIGGFLTDGPARDAARRRAYAYGRSMTWANVGRQYRDLFAQVATTTDRRDQRAAGAAAHAASRFDREPTSLG